MTRLWVASLWIAPALLAQMNMPIGIVRGNVVLWTGSPRAGEIEIRGTEDAVYSCLFDLRTYFEREHQMIAIAALNPGDQVEVVADRKPGSSNCYARTVHVVDLGELHRRSRAPSSSTEAFAPRGDFTFGGVVIADAPSRMTVRTHAGAIDVVLRPDTHYLNDGLRVNAPVLINKHVFVRAGRGGDGDLEAYQVVWGEIIIAK